jgi:hypothetical protein
VVNKLPERIFDLVHFEPFLAAVHRPAQPAQQSPLAAAVELNAQCCGHVRVIAGAAQKQSVKKSLPLRRASPVD